MNPGLRHHFLLTLRLNFRSKQALVYGYLVPVLFLLAFGGIFRGDTPLLSHEMGQLLTISLLGGACFGLPTALVGERERGVWRRYRLLPVPLGAMVAGTLCARLVLVGSAALLQVALARLVYGTPGPLHWGQAVVGFLFVAYAFLGLGLLIAALADNVPAVQALGQCLFLPMIMIGGVGVPLAILPAWAQRVAGFMPGRYAVDVLQRTFTEPSGLTGAKFSLLALVVIGTAAGLCGLRFFRWDAGRPRPRAALGWAGVALAAWAAVGLAALLGGRLTPVTPACAGYAELTFAQMNQITYEDLPGDNEFATRLAKPFTAAQAEAMGAWAAKLRSWPPAGAPDAGQSVLNLLSVAAIADLSADLREAEMARAVFEELQARHARHPLRQILAWIILHPEAGEVVTFAPELGLRRHPLAPYVRERNVLYAKKFLGRLLGKIPD